MKTEITLNEILPKEFYPNNEGVIVCELTLEQVDKIAEILINLQNRIDKAIEHINKYGKEKQLEEDYLMNRYNLVIYNVTLLDILEGEEDE